MNNDILKGEDVLIQKQPDNQLVTELRELVVELYDTASDAFYHNVVSAIDGGTEEEFKAAAAKYEYLLKSLESLKEAFVNLETAFSC